MRRDRGRGVGVGGGGGGGVGGGVGGGGGTSILFQTHSVESEGEKETSEGLKQRRGLSSGFVAEAEAEGCEGEERGGSAALGKKWVRVSRRGESVEMVNTQVGSV